MSSSTTRSIIDSNEFSDENGRRSSGSRRPNAARERSRIQNLRDAFQSLQSALPAVPPSTKLSKLDVLLMASAYIAHLGRLVEENGKQDLAIPGGQIVTFHPVKIILMMIYHDYILSCLVIGQKWPMRARLYAGLNYSGSRGPYDPPKACSHHHSADNPM